MTASKQRMEHSTYAMFSHKSLTSKNEFKTCRMHNALLLCAAINNNGQWVIFTTACLHCNTYCNKPPPVALGLPRGFWMTSLSFHDPVQTIPLSDQCKHNFKTDDKFQHVKLNLTLPELTPIGVTWPQLTHLHNKHSYFTVRIKNL